MAEVRLNPEKTALVVIDIQKGIAAMGRKLGPYGSEQVIGNVSDLVKKFRSANATTVLVRVTTIDGKDVLRPTVDVAPAWASGERPKDWSEFVDEIKPTARDIVITKRQWGAFHGTELDLQLRRRGITTIVLCGVSTNIGVETTAREAYQHGYDQVFAIDAMTAASKEEHETTKKFIFPRLGLVRATEEVLKMIE